MTQSILIGSMRRSGGTLVARLLDGHPECSVFPFENWNTRRKARYRWDHQLLFRWLSPARKLDVCGFHGSYRNKLARWDDELDWAACRSELLGVAAGCATPAALYRAGAEWYFRHYHESALRSQLVNHCAQLCLLEDWQRERIFGPHRLLVTVRDPRAVYSSLEHHRPARMSRRSLARFCDQWETTLQRYWDAPSALSFRFEDLLREPEKIMHSVCSELGIRFDPVVLEPTHLGIAAEANTSFERTSGIDPSANDSWRERIAAGDRARIEDRLAPHLDRLGYS